MLGALQTYDNQASFSMPAIDTGGYDFSDFSFDDPQIQSNISFAESNAYPDPSLFSNQTKTSTSICAFTADPSNQYVVANDEEFPVPNHSLIDNQTGLAPDRPLGCTEAKRSGWDMDGWWYRGDHDNCPIPTIHRHDHCGHVTFAGLHDVLKLVTDIIQRSRAFDTAAQGQ